MDTPKIPTLKDAQKPQVKIKGLGAGLTLFDRLKQFKKKDLAFILAGLGTLFMAPLAEHFMMAPENGDATMSPGWGGGKGGANFFGGGSSPYESGPNGGIASGGAIGGGGDIITPLNVRDPSALVMGPGSSQQPPAGSVTPPTPPPTAPSRSSDDLKDALAGAATRAASQAVKRAPLPVPKVALGGSGLRGLGVAGGGSSASAGMAAPGAAAGSVGGGGGSGLNLVRTNPNFKGVAGPRGSGNPQGLERTKGAGANAGDAFSRSGNALANLNGAASEQIPTAGSGFGGNGQGGVGQNDKGTGGSGPGGSKSVGESLAFIAAKERMMKNLELEFEKRKLNDMGLVFAGIRNDMLKSIATKGIAEPLGAWLGGIISKGPNGGAETVAGYFCGPDNTFYPKGEFCRTTNGYLGQPGQGGACAAMGGSAPIKCSAETTGPSSGAAAPKSTREDGLSDLRAGLGSACTEMRSTDGGANATVTAYFSVSGPVQNAAKRAETARNLLIPGGDVKCGGSVAPAGKTASELLTAAKAKLTAGGMNANPVSAAGGTTTPADANGEQAAKPALDEMITLVAEKDAQKATASAGVISEAYKLVTEAEGVIANAKAAIGAEPEAYKPVDPAKDPKALDPTGMTRVLAVTRSQEQVRGLAGTLETQAGKLKTIITAAESHNPMTGSGGSLPITIRLNKYNEELKAAVEPAGEGATAAAAPTAPQVEGNGPMKTEQTALLGKLNEVKTTLTATPTDETRQAAKAKLEAAAADVSGLQTKHKDALVELQTNAKDAKIEK